jgi:hypothetical protein
VAATGDFGVQIGADSDMQNPYGVAIGYNSSISGRLSTGIGSDIILSSDSSVTVGAFSNVSGIHSIGLGFGATVSGSNSIAIGRGTAVTASNEVFIGNAATTSIGGTVNWTATSDGRFKTNVQSNVPGLDFINKLTPVTYNFDTDKLNSFNGTAGLDAASKAKGTYSGFIAQDVHQAAQDLGYDFSGVKVPQNPEEEMYGIRYAEFVVPLVKATQELDQKIATQDAQIAKQQEILAQQQELMEKYGQKLEQYNAAVTQLKAELEALEVEVKTQSTGLEAYAGEEK